MTTATMVEFRLLGPLEVGIGSTRVAIAGGRQRVILAALLLRANRTVTRSDLIATVWDEDPPKTAWHQIQNGMSQVRRALDRHGVADLLCHEPEGYRLRVEPDQLDLSRFESEVARGRRLAAANEKAEAAQALRGAVSLWRGPALVGLTGSVLEREAARLNELRLVALEDCAELELACGGGQHGLIAELSSLTAEHPLRERLAASYLLALYRGGRQAESLGAYRRVASALSDDLGVDPGPELRRRYEAILRCDPALDAPTVTDGEEPVTGRPAQLPVGAARFVGRAEHLRRLDELLDTPATMPICAVSGTAGVGKTALAVHWAHRVAGRFPDGQLYVNLHGFDPTGAALAPGDAIRGFLDALRVPAPAIPADLAAQAGLYRSLLAGKRVLVVLDNARDAEQVRPLLPGSADCLVLITSRDELTSLVAVEGAHPLAVDLPSQEEARELVARRLGADRTAAEPYAVEELIARCARLPLAMVIVAARAVTRPQLPLGLLVDELRESAGGLDAFDGGDSATDVRAVFSWSYRTLGAEAARLFRLLGRHCGQDIALPAVASLAGVTPARARLVLAELTRAHLVSEQAHGRYTFHDLLRAYAAELAEANDGDEEHHAAAHRLFDHYLHAAHDAAQLLEPHRETIAIEPAVPGVAPVSLTTFGQAHAWLETEHRVLVHTIDRAAEQGFGTHTWQLACTLLTYFQRRGHWHDQAATLQVALSATRRAADPLGQAYSLLGLARAYFRLGRQDDAHAILIESLDLFAHCGHDLGRARAYGSLAFVYTSQGRYREALEHLQTSLDLFQADGRPQGEGQLLNDLGWNHALLGNYQQALIHCHRALMLLRQVNDLHGQASTWDSLGYVYAQLGRYERAIACYRQALRLFREVGERYLEADTLTHLGDNHQARGDLDTSRVIWREALAILDELGHPAAEEVRVRLRHLDQPAPALSLA